jgi:hypothetical protein
MPIKELWSIYINRHVYKNLRRQLAVSNCDKQTAVAMADVEEKVEYEVEWKGGAARDMDNAADRFRASANAIGKKVRPRYGP